MDIDKIQANVMGYHEKLAIYRGDGDEQSHVKISEYKIVTGMGKSNLQGYDLKKWTIGLS